MNELFGNEYRRQEARCASGIIDEQLRRDSRTWLMRHFAEHLFLEAADTAGR